MAGRKSYIIIIALLLALSPLGWLAAEPVATHFYTNFTAGELTRKLDARADFAKSFDGARELTNFIVAPHGGAYKRPGSYYVATAPSPGHQVRLIPMQITDKLGYVIEMGHETMRFYSEHGLVGDVDSYTKLLLHFNAGGQKQTVVDWGDTGHSSFTWRTYTHTTSGPVIFGASVLYNNFATGTSNGLSVADHADWYMGANEACIDFRLRFYTNYGGNERFSIIHQYNSGDDDWVDLFMDAGTLRFEIIDNGTATVQMSYAWAPTTEQTYHVAVIRGWNGNVNDWAITIDGAAVATTTDADPWIDVNGPLWIFDGATNPVGGDYGARVRGVVAWMDELRVSKGVARWTADFQPHDRQYPNELTGGGLSATPVEIATPFQSEDLPDIHFAQSVDVIYFAHPNYDVRKLTRSAHSTWAISTPTFTNDPFTSANNYPSAVTFHEERLVFANTNANPNTMWFSVAGDYTDFTTGSNSSDAMTLTLGATSLNEIQWLHSGPALVLGTIGAEWTVGPMTSSEPLSPSNVQAKQHSTHGSSNVTPVQVGRQIIYGHRSRHQIRNLRYHFESDGYLSSWVSILAEHLFSGRDIVQFAWQEEPAATLWTVMSDGDLVGLTFIPDQKVFAFHEHETEGLYTSAAVITNAQGYDELWVAVNRNELIGDTKYIEYFKQPEYDTATEFFYVDSGLTYDGAAVTNITGADHLELRSVFVFADGEYIGANSILSGALTTPLDTAASVITIGLPYTATLETTDLPPGLGKHNLIKGIVPYFHKTYQGEYGYYDHDGYEWTEIDFTERLADQGLSATDGFTGNIELDFGAGWRLNQTIFFRSDEPVPFHLGGLQVNFQ